MEIDIDLINVMKFLIFFNLKIWLLANAITIGSAFDETNQGCYLDTNGKLKFIYSEKAANFCEIFPLLLTVCTVVKSKGKISQNFVAFSEYMNFKVIVRMDGHMVYAK